MLHFPLVHVDLSTTTMKVIAMYRTQNINVENHEDKGVKSKSMQIIPLKSYNPLKPEQANNFNNESK